MVELFAHGLHILIYRAVKKSGIHARGIDVGVAEHLGDAYKRHMVVERHGGECVAGDVSGQMFGNLCKVCDFLQIGIAALIGEYRYRDVVGKDLRMILVFIHDGLRYLKQRDGTQFTGFLAVLVYPFVAVSVYNDVGAF